MGWLLSLMTELARLVGTGGDVMGRGAGAGTVAAAGSLPFVVGRRVNKEEGRVPTGTGGGLAILVGDTTDDW